MTNYIPLRNVLRLIPKPLLQQSQEADFLSWMLDAYRDLPSPARTISKVEIFEIIDGKVELPSRIKEINLVTWMKQEPCSDDLNSLQDCVDNPEPEETWYNTESICRYTLNYKMFLDSIYYHNNFMPLKYYGTSDSILCKDCPNKYYTCMYGFSVTPERIMYLDLKDGFICIDYESEILDEDGNYLIVDYPKVQEYLYKYAMYKHWEERAAMKEEGAGQIYVNMLQQAEIARKAARGQILGRNMDPANIQKINGGQYKKLIRVPEVYVYAR